MRRIIWSDEAVAELDAIRAYVSQFAPIASERLVERLIRAASLLGQHPEPGRPISKGRRELTVVRPYVIRYRVEDDGVVVLRCWHGARRSGGR